MGRVWGLIVRPAVLMLAVCIPVAGCSTACPAIGWVNSVTVELAGDLSRVDSVQLCADGACSELRPEPGTAAPRIVVTTPLDASAPFTPEAQPTMAPFYASRVDADTWRFTVVNMSSPDHVTAKALSATGEVLAVKEADLDWNRVGGSAQCGGPGEASPVELTVPNG
ncbi:hypothetical protein GU243_19960 [Pseudarthrobacter psychrotolerans]|uniref:Secreted protein n=1 Tax=Pseudarthrobacter psychrotolerans TaxID=2697569 RepID=A0A6P1NR85_9MICC|nr:hypothetical protein [Pseudarthrobacter psychrotolerans]QHK21593.1 hypothetical protein GU243_19960 [Pseudarthrobacter psychrotolerans]